MKIAFISREYIPRNASTIRVLKLYPGLVQVGYKISLLIPENSQNLNLKKNLEPQLKIGLTRNYLWSEVFDKYTLLKQLEPDVIHVINVGLRSFLPGLIYKILHGKKSTLLLLDIDENAYLLKTNLLSRFCTKYYSLICYISSDIVLSASSYLRECVLKYNSKTYYLPYAGDDDKVIEVKKKNYDSDDIIIFYLGTYQHNFDIDVYEKSIIRILNNEKSKLKFIFSGDGPNRLALKKRLSTYPNVIFTGYLNEEDLHNQMIQADAFILPLRDNEFNRCRCPNKIFIYLKYNKLILTNKVGEVSNILGENAVYFNINDCDDLVLKLLSVDKRNIDYTGILKTHSWKYRVKEYITILHENKKDLN
jgi:glycosyltransferase involved in cell wall biosynthesis